MSFLAPIFLVGLLAVALPLAIHFIRRDKPPKVVFSTLRFFQQTTRKQFLFQKLQQWLLLLLRALVVTLFVLAFSRPFFSEQLSGWANLAPRSEVILIDTSASMAYGDYLPRAQKRARDLINAMGPSDEVALVRFSDKPYVVVDLSKDKAAALAAIDTLAVESHKSTRFFPALRLADDLFKSSTYEDRALHLISDFQALGLTGLEEGWRLQPALGFTAHDISEEETRNLAITGVKAPSTVRTNREEEEIFVRVRSLGSFKQDQAQLNLTVNGKSQLQQTVEFGNRSEVVVPMQLKLEGEGSHRVEVAVDDEFYPADNHYYFSVDVLPKINVLVVNGEASNNWYDDEGHWFSLALSGEGGSPFAVTSVSPNGLKNTNLEGYHVLVFLNTGAVTTARAQAVEDFVRAGGSVLWAPGDRVQAASFNRQFGNISPATLIQVGQKNRDDYLLIADIERRHPILQPLDVDWNVRFEGHWEIKPADDAAVLMRFDNGAPALVERELDAGRLLLFASALDLEWNNLPLKGMYLPFVHEMLKHLAQTVEKKPAYQVGDAVAWPNPNQVTILDPDGNNVTVGEGGYLRLNDVGIYQATTTADNQPQFYAVNTQIEESDFARTPASSLLDSIINPESKPLQSREVRTQLLKEELEKPQRLWWWLLVLAAVALMVEMTLARRTHR